jgi:hypothetical protein
MPPINDALVSLINTIGVGGFILISVVMFLLFNLPTFITNAIKAHKEAKTAKSFENAVVHTKEDVLTEFSKLKESSEKLILELKDDFVKSQNFSHEEMLLISENLNKINNALIIMEQIMRNVISEEDTIKIMEYFLGFKKCLKSNIKNKILTILENDPDKDGVLQITLKKDIESAWLDFKSEVDQLNTPINLKSYFDKYEESLWSDVGLFRQIISIASNENQDLAKKKDAIDKYLETGLRRMHADLRTHLQAIKNIRGD